MEDIKKRKGWYIVAMAILIVGLTTASEAGFWRATPTTITPTSNTTIVNITTELWVNGTKIISGGNITYNITNNYYNITQNTTLNITNNITNPAYNLSVNATKCTGSQASSFNGADFSCVSLSFATVSYVDNLVATLVNITYYSDEIYINKVNNNNFTLNESKLNNTVQELIPLSASYFLDNRSSDISGKRTLSLSQNSTPVNITYSALGIGTTELTTFCTQSGVPNIDFIPDGTYHVHFHGYKTGVSNTVRIYANITRWNGSRELFMGRTEFSEILGTDIASEFDIHSTLPKITINTTDRLCVKFIADVTNTAGGAPTVIFSFQDITSAGIETPSNFNAVFSMFYTKNESDNKYLLISDQRYNDSSAIAQVNGTVNAIKETPFSHNSSGIYANNTIGENDSYVRNSFSDYAESGYLYSSTDIHAAGNIDSESAISSTGADGSGYGLKVSEKISVIKGIDFGSVSNFIKDSSADLNITTNGYLNIKTNSGLFIEPYSACPANNIVTFTPTGFLNCVLNWTPDLTPVYNAIGGNMTGVTKNGTLVSFSGIMSTSYITSSSYILSGGDLYTAGTGDDFWVGSTSQSTAGAQINYTGNAKFNKTISSDNITTNLINIGGVTLGDSVLSVWGNVAVANNLTSTGRISAVEISGTINMPNYVLQSTTLSTTSSSVIDTSLKFLLTSGKYYFIDCTLIVNSSNAANGVRLAVYYPSGSIQGLRATIPQAAAGTDSHYVTDTMLSGTSYTSTAVVTANLDYSATIKGSLYAGSSGYFNVTFGSEDNTNTTRLRQGSICAFTRVQ